MLTRLAALATSLAVAGCTVFGDRSGTAEPAFTVLARQGEVEIRQYGPRLAAETTVEADEEQARNEGFRRLAGYIFGGNKGAASIAMTAPVAQAPAAAGTTIAMTAPVAQAPAAGAATGATAGQGGWVVRFFMPAGYTLATLPVPDNPAVRLVEVPGETVAVLRYTGSRGPGAVAARNAALLRDLASGPWQPAGPPLAWFYDPPWTLPWLRRNEAVVPVAPR